MTRNIDVTKPVSEEEMAYLRQRPWMLEDAKRRGIEVVVGTSDSQEDDEGEEDYSSWNKAQLLEEIERRNADRDEDDQIEPESQKNADLVAALEADDEEADDEDDDEA